MAQSSKEKIASFVFAGIALATLIALVFLPRTIDDRTFPIIRFIAAFASGMSAFLFLGDVELGIKKFPKLAIKASGGFALFMIVWFSFFYGVPERDGNSTKTKAELSYRYLTVVNDYPTLALSILKPSLEDNITLEVLSRVLGIENLPSVYTGNQVFGELENFKFETGNEKTLEILNYHQGLRSFDTESSTQKTLSRRGQSLNNDQAELEEIDDKLNDLPRGLSSFMKGEDDTSTFHYAPLLMPFQESLEDASFTSQWNGIEISNQPPNHYLIQYPRLGDLEQFGLEDEHTYRINEYLKSDWIKKIVRANPDLRGFFAFVYPYAENEWDFLRLLNFCRVPRDFVQREMPAPYVKFLDIENSGNDPLTLQSATLEEVEFPAYKLTDVDQR